MKESSLEGGGVESAIPPCGTGLRNYFSKMNPTHCVYNETLAVLEMSLSYNSYKYEAVYKKVKFV